MNTTDLFDSQANFVALANTMGHAVLLETLKLAAYYAQHSNGTHFKSRFWSQQVLSEAKSCFIFIQGTGLNTIINRFGMNYDSEAIKDGFNYYIRHS